MQHPLAGVVRVAAKALVLLAGWLVASLAPLLAVVLWTSYGGSVYVPEVVAVVVRARAERRADHRAGGHRGGADRASRRPPPFVTLTVTVGTWILNFVAAVHGGMWERAAGYHAHRDGRGVSARPDSRRRRPDRDGLDPRGTGCWRRSGCAPEWRSAAALQESAALAAVAVAAIAVERGVRASWDLSESSRQFVLASRRSGAADHSRRRFESRRTLRPRIRGVPISNIGPAQAAPRAAVHAGASTCRRPPSACSSKPTSQYGEVWYDLDGRRAMSRGTTAGSRARDDLLLAGHPGARGRRRRAVSRTSAGSARRAAPPRCSYGIWPATVIAAGLHCFKGGGHDENRSLAIARRLVAVGAVRPCGPPTSRSISARSRSADRRRRLRRWSGRGWSHRTAPTR